jgi:hypothetical protein
MIMKVKLMAREGESGSEDDRKRFAFPFHTLRNDSPTVPGDPHLNYRLPKCDVAKVGTEKNYTIVASTNH